MDNLVLITSVICITNRPLSYTNTRSVFTHEERFEQTIKTIQTIREKIPNSKIFIVECSILNDKQTDYLIKNSDYFLNLYDDENIRNQTSSVSKSLGEGIMTICAIEYIQNNNINYDNFFKITGRYWLSDNFNYNNFENDDIIVHYIHNNDNNTCTSLYKLHKTNVNDFHIFLCSNMKLMFQCIGYEVLFALFLKLSKHNKIVHLNKIGVNGYISVSNDFIDN
jgi:hypothetical protein